MSIINTAHLDMDFYCKVKRALENKTIAELINKFHADTNITLAIDPKPIKILTHAFYKAYNKYNSLEYIFKKSAELNYEIPYAGIFDEEYFIISEFIKGKIGDEDSCDWEEGLLLPKSYKKAKKFNRKVSLGHTHPSLKYKDGRPKPYGAICSAIKYDETNPEEYTPSKRVLDSGLYNDYGGDYLEMFFLAEEVDIISHFFSIMSPRENQIGFFELKPKGKVIYHPWEVISP